MADDQVPKDVMAPAGPMPLTDECHQYEGWEEMPPEISKYWRQRHDLFSLYDSGIYLTDAAWFGVTAEPIAHQIATQLANTHHTTTSSHINNHNPRVIVDLFAGAGGNTIAFALQDHWDVVIGIEIDAATLACAQHNAALYGVADRIMWVHGDCMDFLRRLKRFPWTLSPELQVFGLGLDGGGGRGQHGKESRLRNKGAKPSVDDELASSVQLFASPPWGGPMYSGEDVLDLDAMEPYGVSALHESMKPMAHAMFLPRNGDLNQLASLVPDNAAGKLDVVQYCINGSSKGMVAYYPPEYSQDN